MPLIGVIGEEKFIMPSPNSREKAGWLFFIVVFGW